MVRTTSFREQIITPQTFLNKVAELNAYENFSSRVTPLQLEFELVKDNQPRLIRYQRVMAILRAYDLISDDAKKFPVNAFIKGMFIDDQSAMTEKYSNRIFECFRSVNYNESDILSITSQLERGKTRRELFNALMQYKFAVRGLDAYWAGYLMMPTGCLIAARFTTDLFGEHLASVNKSLDEMLVSLMGEKAKPITVAELIDKYGYPLVTDQELTNIDIDHM